MTSGSHESSGEYKKRLHAEHRRAAEAMVRIIALREADGHLSPELDPATYEGSVRSSLFSLQHDALQADFSEEFAEPRNPSLAESLMSPHLADMAQPGRPLTRDRLLHLDPDLLRIAESMEEGGIDWPDDETVFHDVLPEDFDDHAFGLRLVDRGRAYNNFPAILTAEPAIPDQDEHMVDFMSRTKFFQYASKPYLIRAHALQPEFMGALQAEMARKGSTDEWAQSLYSAVTEEHPDPEDLILLRASRLAYQFLINLMRKDDLQIQGRVLTMSLQHEIADPVEELWT